MLSRTLMQWSVGGLGVFHVVQPAGQTFRQKSELSSVSKECGSAESKSYNQREEAA